MLAILSSEIAQEFSKKTGLNVLPLQPFEKLDTPVKSHADMLICIINDHIFCYREYYEKNKSLFDEISKDFTIVKVDKACQKEYPNDIGLNCLVIGKLLVSKNDATAKEILDFAIENGYKILNVKQGYTACSTLVINDLSAITTDKGIYEALIQEGKRALLVSTNGIKLNGYNCGFIGGAGVIIENSAYFFGDIKLHPDYTKILEFLSLENCKVESILCGGVCDFGGVKLIN